LPRLGLGMATTKVFAPLAMDPLGLISSPLAHVSARGTPSMVRWPAFKE